MSRLIEINTTDGVGFGNADETDAPLNVAGEFNVAGTLNLDQALGISGVVLDDSQSPIQDATVGVTLTENGQDVIYDTTDVNGEYSFTEHPDGDSTKQEWHVTAAKNDNGDLFNAESKPFVRATLPPTIIQATGGDVVQDVTLNGVDFRIHAFTTVGSQTFEVTNAPAQNDTVDVLVVGGGGGGGGAGSSGSLGGGGGGAGGVLFEQGVSVVAQIFAVQVGDGGSAGLAASTPTGQAGDGGDSAVFGLTALGGGGGANGADGTNGGDGGSGGGAARNGGNGGAGLQPTSADGGFGNDGGSNGQGATGGGGASQPGQVNTTGGSIPGGAGGDGKEFSSEFSSSFGENGFFGGGGGGGGYDTAPTAPGGVGGGGDAVQNAPATPGQDNTGGGGGGGYREGSDVLYDGADGGSGIVLIRYEI